MGNCITIEHTSDALSSRGLPKCACCSVSGTIPWQQLAEAQRRLYWVKSGKVLYCKRCWADRTMERRQYRRMREHYKRAKELLYPRPQLQPSLKRINSGEEWDGTASFREQWSPCPFVASLLAQDANAAHPGTAACDAAAPWAADAPDSTISTPPSDGGSACLEDQQQQEQQQELDEEEERAIAARARQLWQQQQLRELEQLQQELGIEAVTEVELCKGELFKGDSAELAEGLGAPLRASSALKGVRCPKGQGGAAASPVEDSASEDGELSGGSPGARWSPLPRKQHAPAFGAGLAERADSANSEDWADQNAACTANECGSGSQPGRGACCSVASGEQVALQEGMALGRAMLA